jgi:hypothetical protein
MIYHNKNRPRSHFKTQGSYGSWLVRHAGEFAGSVHNENTIGGLCYCRIRIYGKNYFAHRLIWLSKYGVNPKIIDHIDGNGLNNKLSNLREVSAKQNSLNRSAPVNGVKINGVYHRKKCNSWEASIKVDGTYKYLGRHKTLLDAACARISYENLVGGYRRGLNNE